MTSVPLKQTARKGPRTFCNPLERWRVQEKQKEEKWKKRKKKKVKKTKVKYRVEKFVKKVPRKYFMAERKEEDVDKKGRKSDSCPKANMPWESLEDGSFCYC